MSGWLINSPQRLTLEDGVDELHVWLASGKLRVIGTDGPARIEVAKIGRKGVAVTLANRVLSVRHEFPQNWWTKFGPFWWFLSGWRNYHVNVVIAVPPTALASLTLVSGSVVASGLRSGATVDVTSGSISLMGLGGTVRAKTVSGSVQAVGVAGDLGLETVSGEIALAESSAERVYARTISGSVTCDLDNPNARDVRLDTTSGEIIVRVPADADLDVNLSAISGRVTSAFREVRSHATPGLHGASGRIGQGTGTLNAHAVSGSVSLLARPTDDDGFVEDDQRSNGVEDDQRGMSAVFSHGRLRLYLLHLLSEGPKHGYELIRLLENRFHGLYAPSAGTIYPRLARMEADGLVTHAASGGRKVYHITDSGRTEITMRAAELQQLEAEIHASVADLTALAEDVDESVRGSVRDLKRELRQAKHEGQTSRVDEWRQRRQAWQSAAAPTVRPDDASEVQRRATDLAAEVHRLVGLGRASTEDLRVAATVLDSVRDQLRHILRA